jgi:hypothetical protein
VLFERGIAIMNGTIRIRHAWLWGCLAAAVLALAAPTWAAPADCVSAGATAVVDNGGGSCLALGVGATAGNNAAGTINHTTAVGNGSTASGANASAFGDFAKATGSESLAIGTGTFATGLESTAVGPFSAASGADSTAIGHFAGASGANSTATGEFSSASGTNSTALGSSAKATDTNSVALGHGSATGGRANVVSVGFVGGERQITNVAAGTAPTDAVNVSQLQGITSGISSALNTHINSVGDTAFAGVADAMALSYPVWFSKPGDTSLTGGYGYYRGQNAVGGGIYHLDESGKFTYGVGIAFSPNTGGAGVRAGFSVKLF